MDSLIHSQERARQLQLFRRRAWLAVVLCFATRGADAAFGLNLIDSTEPVTAKEVHSCLASREAPG